MKIVKKVIDRECASELRCNYGCGQDASETEISETPYATYICGDIECWNSFCLEFWSPLDVDEVEVDICDLCEGEKVDEDDDFQDLDGDEVCEYCWADAKGDA